MSAMQTYPYRDDAWKVADRYGRLGRTATQDLAAWIEKAMNESERALCQENRELREALEAMHADALEHGPIDPDSELYKQVTAVLAKVGVET